MNECVGRKEKSLLFLLTFHCVVFGFLLVLSVYEKKSLKVHTAQGQILNLDKRRIVAQVHICRNVVLLTDHHDPFLEVVEVSNNVRPK